MTGVFLTLLIIFDYSFYSHLALKRICPFLGGIAAAFLTRSPLVRRMAIHRIAAIGILTLLSIAVFLYSSVYEPVSLLCVSVAFIGIASGNSLFGILTHKTSRLLGQISYSIYLLHGILLFSVTRFIVGFPVACSFSPVGHFVFIGAISILLIVLCSFTYYYIELPCINASPVAVSRIQAYLRKIKLKRLARSA